MFLLISVSSKSTSPPLAYFPPICKLMGMVNTTISQSVETSTLPAAGAVVSFLLMPRVALFSMNGLKTSLWAESDIGSRFPDIVIRISLLSRISSSSLLARRVKFSLSSKVLSETHSPSVAITTLSSTSAPSSPSVSRQNTHR